MKIWEILKEENLGKTVKDNKEREYRIAISISKKTLLFPIKSSICAEFEQAEIMTLDFEFTQQSVTFEEVLNSNKRCRVEHEMLNKEIEKINELSNESANYFLIEFKNGKYLKFKYLLELFIWIFPNWKIKQIFNEAKWYLEP